MKVIIVSPEPADTGAFIRAFPFTAILHLQKPTKEYPAMGEKTTFYICEGAVCRPPVTDIEQFMNKKH